MCMRGLVIDEPWISKILQGLKCWEMRSGHTTIREQIALIRKGSGKVVGVARLVGCRGPLDLKELEANADNITYRWRCFVPGRQPNGLPPGSWHP